MKHSAKIIIKVPAVPIAQPRPRATRRGAHAAVYNPAGPIDAFKASVRLAASQVFQGSPLEGPLRVDVEFVFPRTKGQTWKRKPMPRLWHAKKPDRDNLDKAVLDSLNQLIWVDDAQVCDGRITKHIAAGDESPGVTITITTLDDATDIDAEDNEPRANPKALARGTVITLTGVSRKGKNRIKRDGSEYVVDYRSDYVACLDDSGYFVRSMKNQETRWIKQVDDADFAISETAEV